ncbi:hypothetical protein QFZ94_008657 [Paraburkholderia sp. JPY465]
MAAYTSLRSKHEKLVGPTRDYWAVVRLLDHFVSRGSMPPAHTDGSADRCVLGRPLSPCQRNVARLLTAASSFSEPGKEICTTMP